jgi:tripartite-type tricarboxylate transporter receptor subunit TctC
MIRMRNAVSAVLLALAAVLAPVAGAQQFPVKPVRMVLPFPPGGSLDVVARPLSIKMGELMGHQVIVDYRVGASGNIGTEHVARAPADGYTILIHTLPFVVNPSIYSKLPYDAVRDFAAVSLLAAAPFVLVVHPSVPAKSVKDLIALARARPGQLNYASAGNGTNLHVAAELFKNMTQTNIVHIPYKGGGPALTALLSGESDLSFLGVVPASPHVKSGRLRALGITSLKRSGVLPDVPTVSEAGVKGYEFAAWYGILAPAGTPAPVIATLNGHIVKAMHSPEVMKRVAQEGAEIIAGAPEAFATYLKSELQRWAAVVKAAGLRAD